MLVRRLVFLGAALAALLLSLPALAGEIQRHEFESPALKRKIAANIYLPDGYATSGLRYPVLYLLHGNGGDENEWLLRGKLQQAADTLIASGEMPPAVIVMPAAGTTWYVDRKEAMETAFIRDLLPACEKQFRVYDDRAGRLVGGLSMGGYGALRFALKYPEMFQAAALLSPAIYDPEPPENSSARRVNVFGAEAFDPAIWRALNYPALIDGFLAKRIALPMYINSGDDDDFQIEYHAAMLYSKLRAARQPAELRIVNGAHVWPVWESTIAEAMKYIFQTAKRPGPL